MELRCPSCRKPVVLMTGPGLQACGACKNKYHWQLFPASEVEPERGAAAEPVVLDGQACCFYHAKKKAAVACDCCGRFLCAMCDLDWSGKHVCPSCLESRRKGDAPAEQAALFTNKVVRYDAVAISISGLALVLSLPFWFISFLYWPAVLIALFFLHRSARNKPRSLLVTARRVRWNWFAAWVIAVLGTLGGLTFGLFILAELLKKKP